jgi:hypothetical protein
MDELNTPILTEIDLTLSDISDFLLSKNKAYLISAISHLSTALEAII